MTLSVRRPSRRFVCLVSAAVLSAGLLAAVEAQAPSAERTPSAERDFLTRIRRLTVEGRRAGEGYWSKDGRQLVFQSEREPGNPFYQIYLMDMASGDVTRMSPGMGKTTCSFINPETGDVLFASTHHDARSKQLQEEELAFRASGKERRYSWDYDPEMELYVRNARTRNPSSSDEQAGLRRRGKHLTGWSVDRLCVHARRLRSAALRGRAEAARSRSQLLRRDLHHAGRRRRIRRAASHKGSRV